ncbi:hypothetical protein [Verrucomicrobium spinosum]|uniref:hypothetical protein n=1 Tax=Verrucomicrobium spinosum TaxID=2736 RepID=UPI0001744B67|nr:hypothetical protein [Verrucomicrobium spinosum]
MKRWLTTAICILTALHLTGGSWGWLQLVAWSRMLQDYSREKGLVLAVKETFDGEHPCSMCLDLQERRETDAQSDPLRQYKVEKPCQMLAAVVHTEVPQSPPAGDAATPAYDGRPGCETQWMTRPPTPPPRRDGHFMSVA